MKVKTVCLGVPGKIESIDGDIGAARVGAVAVPVNFMLTPEARPGDFVLVHAGFALKVMDSDAVAEALEIFESVAATRVRMDELYIRLDELAKGMPAVALMEVCGTHTVAIARAGIKARLPKNVNLISGPGCPVCVTPVGEIDMAIELALSGRARLVSFGDMLRVPGSNMNLDAARGRGARIDIVYSPRQALALAERGGEEVVFLAVGFETTAPVIAAVVKAAAAMGLDNFSVLVSHRLIPPALDALLSAASLDGLICPGHVSTVIGWAAYDGVAREHKIPCVVAGFEPVDILESIAMLLEARKTGLAGVANQYSRSVSRWGSPLARQAIDEVFDVADGDWRGLGTIKDSALRLRPEFARFDAAARFRLRARRAPEPEGCRCGEILSGRSAPPDCRLFGAACLPERPVGPCMVSSEGACSAAYLYSEAAG